MNQAKQGMKSNLPIRRWANEEEEEEEEAMKNSDGSNEEDEPRRRSVNKWRKKKHEWMWKNKCERVIRTDKSPFFL